MNTFFKVIGIIAVSFVALIIGIIFLVMVSIAASDDNTSSSSDSAEDTTEIVDSLNDGNSPKSQPSKYTVEQEEAIEQAESYLDTMPMSRKGLIDQLSSEYGGQFPKKTAVFAVNHIKVDWKQEAFESADSYKNNMGMSKAGIFDQLTSEYGEQFTGAQAQYAVDRVFGE